MREEEKKPKTKQTKWTARKLVKKMTFKYIGKQDVLSEAEEGAPPLGP